MNKRKILAMIPAAKIGGAEKMMMIILEALQNAGDFVVLAVGSIDGGNKAIATNGKYILGNSRARRSIIPAMKVIWAERPDIVFLNLGYINLAVFVRLMCSPAKVVARLGNTVTSELPPRGVARLIKILALRVICSACTKVIVQSELMKKDLLSVVSAHRSKIIVLPNVVESDFSHRMSLSNPVKLSNYMFCAATLKKQKRLDLLIAAAVSVMSTVKDIDLVVAGTNKNEIESAGMLDNIDRQIINRLHFIGFVDNILPLIRDSQFCVSSSDYEGSSNYLIEAKTMNKICVLTDCPGANRETFNEYSGVIFVAAGSEKSLAAGMHLAIERTLSVSPRDVAVKDETFSSLSSDRKVWERRLLEVFN